MVHTLIKDFKYSVGCLTNSIRKTTYIMLQNASLWHAMHTVVTNEDTTYPKPIAIQRRITPAPRNAWETKPWFPLGFGTNITKKQPVKKPKNV